MNALYVLALIVFLVLVYLFFVKKKKSSCGCSGGEKNTYLEGMNLHSDEKLLV